MYNSDADAEGEPDDQFESSPPRLQNQGLSLKIKLNPQRKMARSVNNEHIGPRRSSRHAKSSDSPAHPSGSEYSAGSASPSSPVDQGPRRRRRNVDYTEDDEFTQKLQAKNEAYEAPNPYTTAHGRSTKRPDYQESDDTDAANRLFEEDEEDVDIMGKERRPTRSQVRGRSLKQVNSDDEGSIAISTNFGRMTRSRSKKLPDSPIDDDIDVPDPKRQTRASSRRLRKSAQKSREEESYQLNEDDAAGSSEEEMNDGHSTPEDNDVEEDGPRQYRLRARKQVNYALPPPLDPPPGKPKSSRSGKGKSQKGLGWSVNGTDLSRSMNMFVPGDDTDSDAPTRTPRKPLGAGAGAGGGLYAAGTGGLFPDGLAAGTPSNLGKVTDTALADADPLGVNTNVTFEEVGGLDDHINSLKEMTLLPLLYPEVFQRFNLTPPRGVLFHGPPGTGKTLLARALAASCRSNGKGISFFMRKGADCLSKWVGEAERQLRLLFEEARNQQPSIIFFDEIDGLAPVRSSKQDQIHASIVSTLLALMDGMDGRGQVVVIGATNRPDAVDPALRRPGRFDREFYFPLPNLDARAKILSIQTRKWEGWDTEQSKETVNKLAKLTKGYGGADLRALCTEAALNAVQRRYPQIYKSSDRLLLKPETINVQARDFMISVKKLVPSSARSVSSSASPLPSQLQPLLNETLKQVKDILEKALPLNKRRTALEEAEFEDEGDEGALEREILMQKMESLRVYRPRVVLYGEPGMGQSYIGPAALHHLEGYHVQTLDLGSLLGDSTRTVEAGIVQLFVEAKRHQPSVIYIPSLHGWCAAVSETAITTVKAMLDTLSPSDPVLLLAVIDGPFHSVPRDVRHWFGVSKENRVSFTSPNAEKRRNFFDELIGDIRRPPNHFPDGVQRKKRVLEELPIAPPLEPRQPTAAELAVQEANDQRTLTLLRWKLGPILAELKRKHKRFTKSARDEYNLYPDSTWDPFISFSAHNTVTQANGTLPNGTHTERVKENQETAGDVNGTQEQMQTEIVPAEPKLYDVDLETINTDLYKDKFLTPGSFLDEIGKIVHNARVREYEDHDRLYKALAMYTAAEVSIQEFDPTFRLECERMATRELKRREQRRAERRKSRATSREGSVSGNGSGGEHGLRRSTRNSGQPIEIKITDPTKLERTLKRQRSQEANGDIQNAGEISGDDHESKRSKMDVIMDDFDRDELDVVGPTSSQTRPISVRFIDDLPQTPSKAARYEMKSNFTLISGSMNEPVHHHSPGFNPDLLNPLPPEQQPLPSLQSLIAPGLDDIHANSIYYNLAEQQLVPQTHNMEQDSRLAISNIIDYHGAPDTICGNPSVVDPGLDLNMAKPQLPSADLMDVPMIGEKDDNLEEIEDSVPLPDFYVDEHLLHELETEYVNRTEHLNVEQLEQLRAMSLNTIWHHRQEWDRNTCVRELFGVIRDFVDQVRELDVSD